MDAPLSTPRMCMRYPTSRHALRGVNFCHRTDFREYSNQTHTNKLPSCTVVQIYRRREEGAAKAKRVAKEENQRQLEIERAQAALAPYTEKARACDGNPPLWRVMPVSAVVRAGVCVLEAKDTTRCPPRQIIPNSTFRRFRDWRSGRGHPCLAQRNFTSLHLDGDMYFQAVTLAYSCVLAQWLRTTPYKILHLLPEPRTWYITV